MQRNSRSRLESKPTGTTLPLVDQADETAVLSASFRAVDYVWSGECCGPLQKQREGSPRCRSSTQSCSAATGKHPLWCTYTYGYWHQRADERHGKPPQGNQELLVAKEEVGRTPGELGVSKSMECDIIPFSALTLSVG